MAIGQLTLPTFNEGAMLPQLAGDRRVVATLNGAPLCGARHMIEVPGTSAADPSVRRQLLEKLGNADAMLVRGPDGAAFVIEGARLTVGGRRPQAGDQVAFATADGAALGDTYKVQAFYRGRGNSSNSTIDALPKLAAIDIAAPPRRYGRLSDGRIGRFATNVFLGGSSVTPIVGAALIVDLVAVTVMGTPVDSPENVNVARALCLAGIGSAILALIGGVTATCIIPACEWLRNAVQAKADRAADAEEGKRNGYGVRGETTGGLSNAYAGVA